MYLKAMEIMNPNTVNDMIEEQAQMLEETDATLEKDCRFYIHPTPSIRMGISGIATNAQRRMVAGCSHVIGRACAQTRNTRAPSPSSDC